MLNTHMQSIDYTFYEEIEVQLIRHHEAVTSPMNNDGILWQ